MFSLPEMLFLCIIALVFIGPKQLPEVARNIARFLNELRHASKGMMNEFMNEKNEIMKEPLQIKAEIQNELTQEVKKETEEKHE